MKKITSLTEEQKAQLPIWTKKWVEIGLSCEPADFEMATEAALKAYKLCNLDKPMVVLRMSSPYSATIGGAFAWKILKVFFKDQVGAQVRDQVGDQVRDQVRAQVRDQVRAQVRDQVGDQVRDQVWDQVGAQVWAQVRAQVRDQVGAQVRAQVWDQVWDQVRAQVRDQVRAQVGNDNFQAVKEGLYNDGISSLWCSFTAFATFFRDVCGWGDAEILTKMEINEQLVKSCGWTWWHQNVLTISDRPEFIKRDEQGRLHSETGMSIRYRDGWGFYNWHGVRIPEGWVTGKPPSASEALTWENIEQRRAACEIVGWKNILSQLDAKIIDIDGDDEIGTLLEADIPDSGKERFLKVMCGTKREFVLPVPREMKTALEANAWTWNLKPNEYRPEVRT